MKRTVSSNGNSARELTVRIWYFFFWNMYNIIYEMSRQSRFDAWYWMLGAGALGRPRSMERGGRREEGSGWGTRVYLWRIHVDIWQNQCNIVKLNNKIKKRIWYVFDRSVYQDLQQQWEGLALITTRKLFSLMSCHWTSVCVTSLASSPV